MAVGFLYLPDSMRCHVSYEPPFLLHTCAFSLIEDEAPPTNSYFCRERVMKIEIFVASSQKHLFMHKTTFFFLARANVLFIEDVEPARSLYMAVEDAYATSFDRIFVLLVQLASQQQTSIFRCVLVYLVTKSRLAPTASSKFLLFCEQYHRQSTPKADWKL